jgi:hypothetical protein
MFTFFLYLYYKLIKEIKNQKLTNNSFFDYSLLNYWLERPNAQWKLESINYTSTSNIQKNQILRIGEIRIRRDFWDKNSDNLFWSIDLITNEKDFQFLSLDDSWKLNRTFIGDIELTNGEKHIQFKVLKE